MFDLRTNNLTAGAVIDQPGGVVATADSFIDSYTYAEQWMPELIPQLHMANGLGKITGLVRLLGDESTYESDMIQHMEEGRLHNIVKNVAESSGEFTSPTAHNLRVDDSILMSDGVTEIQATVTVVTSTTVFTATNDAGGDFSGLSGNVDIICDFSNSYAKGSDDPVAGSRWDPTPYYNYTHILKKAYHVSGSDMVHRVWVNTPYGPRWHNFEVQRTIDLFDNLAEMTHIFHNRKSAGSARGCNGLLPQIEARGNIGNEYITDIEELSDIGRRIKQQAGGCREFTVWGDHQQEAYWRQMLASVNAHYVAGAHYGTFSNDKDMALMLGFKSVYIDGCTFHFTPWGLLDDPTLMGNEKFRQTGLACLIVPSGNKMVSENGNSVSKPYFSVRYRSDGQYNRKREIKIFGPGGTPHKEDTQITIVTSELTNQVIGANEYFAVRTGAFYSA